MWKSTNVNQTVVQFHVLSKWYINWFKSLYGLKQAPKQWHEKFDKVLVLNRYANEIKKMLASNFDLKNMGEADVILGIKITKISYGRMLSQEHYVEKVQLL